jgi:beta-glucosidase
VESEREVVGGLDLRWKVEALTGAGYWTTRTVPEIGLECIVFSDGPAGVRGVTWDERHPSASLPSPVAMGSTWDERLVGRLAALLGDEARAKGVHVLLAPTVNLQRSPLAGRNYEYLSEDPLLAGRIATTFVRALQERGVAGCVKHYVANDSETNRFTVDVEIDERTLREVYLAPFEQVVVRGRVWALMAAYNQVNGVTMTESPLLADPLFTEWGFDGVVVSDWSATRSTEASASGRLGLVMPGPDGPWGEALISAVEAGRVPESAVDDKVRRLRRLASRVNVVKDRTPENDAPALLRHAAAEGMVLLRNTDDLLPLDAEIVRRIAILGSGAEDPSTQGGGSTEVVGPYVVSPLAGLREAFGAGREVITAVGAHIGTGLRPMPGRLMTCPHCGRPGMEVRYLDADGAEVRMEHRTAGRLVWLGEEILRGGTVEVRARFQADVAGSWRIGVAGVGSFHLSVNGQSVLEEVVRPASNSFAAAFGDPPQREIGYSLEIGQTVDILLTYRFDDDQIVAKVVLGVRAPRRSDDEELAHAVALARGADVAVVIVGTDEREEREGLDRLTLDLPGRQNDLVRAVAAVNSRTVVVVNVGAPVLMPWRNDVAGILVSWFPGQEFGHALADVLLGRAEPGGRLPVTWPGRLEDVPVLSTQPVDGKLPYREGLHIGYRAWLAAARAPAYRFGFGLGYATWTYRGLQAPTSAAAGEGVAVTVRLANSGRRPGKEVVQVYLSRLESAIERPAVWLAGFTAVTAEPGEEVDAVIDIAARAFQHWSTTNSRWEAESGVFRLTAGSDVATQPLVCNVEILYDGRGLDH